MLGAQRPRSSPGVCGLAFHKDENKNSRSAALLGRGRGAANTAPAPVCGEAQRVGRDPHVHPERPVRMVQTWVCSSIVYSTRLPGASPPCWAGGRGEPR